MSDLTGSDTSYLRRMSQSSVDDGRPPVIATPLRNRLDELLKSAGWTYEGLTQTQLTLLAGMITERQNLLETVRHLNSEIESARKDADHDSLIPVYNRRAFVRELSRQLSFCYRYNSNACLIFMDLDRFKHINDRFGHATGDDALRKFGEILIAHTRESDLVGRLGGDEFAILLINASEEDARHKAEMFREDVEKLRFGETDAPLGFGLSCGVVHWERGESADQLINRADEAMYAEKRTKPHTRSGQPDG